MIRLSLISDDHNGEEGLPGRTEFIREVPGNSLTDYAYAVADALRAVSGWSVCELLMEITAASFECEDVEESPTTPESKLRKTFIEAALEFKNLQFEPKAIKEECS